MAALLRWGVRFPTRRSLPRLTHQTTQLVSDFGLADRSGLATPQCSYQPIPRPFRAPEAAFDCSRDIRPLVIWCRTLPKSPGLPPSPVGLLHRKGGYPAIPWPEGRGDCRLALRLLAGGRWEGRGADHIMIPVPPAGRWLAPPIRISSPAGRPLLARARTCGLLFALGVVRLVSQGSNAAPPGVSPTRCRRGRIAPGLWHRLASHFGVRTGLGRSREVWNLPALSLLELTCCQARSGMESSFAFAASSNAYPGQAPPPVEF